MTDIDVCHIQAHSLVCLLSNSPTKRKMITFFCFLWFYIFIFSNVFDVLVSSCFSCPFVFFLVRCVLCVFLEEKRFLFWSVFFEISFLILINVFYNGFSMCFDVLLFNFVLGLHALCLCFL